MQKIASFESRLHWLKAIILVANEVLSGLSLMCQLGAMRIMLC